MSESALGSLILNIAEQKCKHSLKCTSSPAHNIANACRHSLYQIWWPNFKTKEKFLSTERRIYDRFLSDICILLFAVAMLVMLRQGRRSYSHELLGS